MDGSLESSEGRNAAQFAAVYTAVRRRFRQPPPPMPRALAPLPLEALVALCRPRAPSPHRESQEHYRCRRSVVATLAAAGVHDEVWTAMMFPEERASLSIVEGSLAGNCRYCAAARALGSAKGRQEPETRKHAAIDIGFDPDTFVSSTRVTGLEVVIPFSQLGTLFSRADPRNWAQPDSEVFRRSEPGVWTRDGWQGGRPWPKPDRGQLYEIALAQINPSIAFEIHNILDISGFRNDLAGPDGAAASAAGELRLQYEYALQQNLGSKLGFIWEPEGIDIDNGWYEAIARPEGGDRWRVSISVEKRLRYTSTQTIPVEISASLNVMAPAFLSLFMHELVYGVLKDLDGGDVPAVARPRGKGASEGKGKRTTMSERAADRKDGA